MLIPKSKIPKKFQPRGFEIIFDDRDIIVGIKEAGILTVSAKWEKDNTVHNSLNNYVRKGNRISKKVAYVVHRLDQATTGLLVFAKTEEVQEKLKDHWYQFEKRYLAVVHGVPKQASGIIESYLEEDEDYVVHSKQSGEGKLAKTEYKVLAQSGKFALIDLKLHTGRKNQIRVHMSDLGTPIVGDQKYGMDQGSKKPMALHSYLLEINHPFSGKRMKFTAPVPSFYKGLVPYNYEGLVLNGIEIQEDKKA